MDSYIRRKIAADILAAQHHIEEARNSLIRAHLDLPDGPLKEEVQQCFQHLFSDQKAPFTGGDSRWFQSHKILDSLYSHE